jgi:hypothetical protein
MRDHGYDLGAFLRENWSTVGPHVVGKLHFYVGDMDNFYLNMAVYQVEDFLATTRNPHYAGSFAYGRPLKGHGFRPTSTGDMLRVMAEEISKNAPQGTRVDAWKYR